MLTLTLYTPDRRVFEKLSVTEVTLPTAEGEVQILDGHAHFVGLIQAGPLVIKAESTIEGVASYGFFEVRAEEIIVCASTYERASEINVERAKSAQSKAEEMLKSPEMDEQSFRKYQAKLQRALVRQQVGASLR